MGEAVKLTRALAKKLGGFEELGRRLGVTGRAAEHYAKGDRMPRPQVRAKLAALGVPESAWGVAATGTPTRTTRRAPAPVTADGATSARIAARVAATAPTREQQEALVVDLDAMLVDALADDKASYRDRASVAAAKNAALRTLASMRGETQVTEVQVLRSPAGQRVLGVLFDALRAHPEACAAAAEKLEQLEAAATTGAAS